MENQKFNLRVVGKEILKIFLGVIVLLILLVGALVVAIRIPAVQTRAVHEASAILSRKLSHEVSIQSVDIDFFNQVILNKVKVLDYKKEVLFYVNRVEGNIGYFNILRPNRLHLANLTLDKPQANMVRYQGTEKVNLTSFIEAINNLITKKDTIRTSTPFEFHIDAITIRNGRFTYNNQNAPRQKFGIDYQHIVADSIYTTFTEIEVGDTMQVKVENLRTTESRSQTRLHELSTHLTYASTFLEFKDLNLRLGRSNLAHFLRFDYRDFGNFAHFNDSVKVTAQIKSSRIFSDDIAMFAPQVRDINEQILFTGNIEGRVDRFHAKNLNVFYGKNTHVVGTVSSHGLPNIKETFLELDLKPSTINAADLRHYLPKPAYNLAQRLGTVKLKGSFIGFFNDFVANGNFNTALGNVVSDLNLKINPRTKLTSYSGYIRTDNFNLGRLLNTSDIITTVSVDGRVKGSGFDLPNARLNLDATIKAVNLYGYNYRNIKTNATLSRQTFTGDFTIRDSNVNLKAKGNINLSKKSPSFDVVADVQHLDFRALGFTNEKINLQTKATLNFKGLNPDEIVGRAKFTQTLLTLNDYVVPTDSVVLVSDLTGDQRVLNIFSEVADIKASGTWDYITLVQDLKVLVHEYRLNFESNDPVIAAYYRNKKKNTPTTYDLTYYVHLKEFNGIIKAFAPDLGISDNSHLEGSFRQGSNAIFSFIGHTDTLYYKNNKFVNNDLELNTSKLPYSPDVLANAFVTSGRQMLSTGANTENLYLEGVWSDRNIGFITNVSQVNSTNRANVSGNLTFLENKLQIVFSNSDINVLGKPWLITPNNVIEISNHGQEIFFKDFVISHLNQRIGIAGMLSPNPSQELNVSVTDFRLENLNPLFNSNIRGLLNATLTARDIYNQPELTSKLTADSVSMDNFLVGQVAGTTGWDNEGDRLSIDLAINRDNKKVLNVTGYYNPQSENNPLDLLAIMDGAPIKLLEPLLNTLIHDLSGTMAGRIRITGPLSGPNLAGSALVSNGRFNFTYLNTYYTFSDRILFTENDITFRDIKIRDALNNQGTISGSIIHQGFQNMILDLRGEFRRLMVLNTTREQNQLYYGTAVATGTATVLGSPTNLQINIDARSEAGTRLSIPLDNSSTVTRENFIRFVNRNVTDTVTVTPVAAKDHVDLSGINMNFNLEVTPDAYLEIILDQTSGDVVRGSGNGRLRMNIDTRGEFTMDGQVEIVRGAYNFTLYHLINKEFVIRPGGTITWNGDPYTGIMNITATYTQNVLIPQSLLNNDATLTNLRIPVMAVMNLTGNLLTPEINLDLEFRNAPSDVETQLARVFADLRNDQDELNRQVFSLLILKRLSERNSFGSNALGEGITGSLSELITNQLGNFLSQVDSNLEVDIGLMAGAGDSGLDQVALRNLQVRLSYSLLEGRLRVSREGGINNGTDNDNPNNLYGTNNSIAGDWRVEYYLGQNGKLRLRMEYLTSQRRFASTSNTATTNISILHTEQFNSFSELFARRRLRRRYQQREQIILDSDVRYEDIK